MRRFRVLDDGDSYYVEVAIEDEVVSAFYKQWEEYRESRKEDNYWWEKYGKDMLPPDEDDLEIQEVGQKEHKHGPRPTCCDAINAINKYEAMEDKGPWIQLDVWEDDPSDDSWDSLRKRPRWLIRKIGAEIQFCPYCGTKLPEVEEKPEDEKPLPVWTPGGGDCGSCGVRNGHGWCECNPPSSHYRIKA